MSEFRIFGPPGTGKTTYLTARIRGAVEKFGSDSVIVASFTKAAARELIGRDLPIDKARCGTLHSHCYRALGLPTIAETKIDEFNKEFPRFEMSSAIKVNPDEGEFDQDPSCENDALMADFQVCRARKQPKETWRNATRLFATAWDEFKFRHNYIDFSDMIEKCINMPERVIPEGTSIGIFDEVQDFTPMQLQLVRAIGSKLKYFMLAGDDDQTIFGFTGATPKAFLTPEIEESHKKILDQSYRVPRKVQAVAENWIKQIEDRQPKEYRPREFEGDVIRMVDANSKAPKAAIERVIEDVDQGKSVMVLASCGYMLQATLANLKERGLPFYNPYKPTRGDWNPLGARRGVSAKERVAAFLGPSGPHAGQARLWTLAELAAWAELVEADAVFNRGAKKEIKELAEHETELSDNGLIKCYTEWFKPSGLNMLAELNPDDLQRIALSTKAKGIEYPIKVFKRFGLEALVNTPKICIGTIHSVKGGQADNVYLFPDISSNAATGIRSKDGYDSVVRQFYVGMTRCREKLAILGDASRIGVKIPI